MSFDPLFFDDKSFVVVITQNPQPGVLKVFADGFYDRAFFDTDWVDVGPPPEVDPTPDYPPVPTDPGYNPGPYNPGGPTQAPFPQPHPMDGGGGLIPEPVVVGDPINAYKQFKFISRYGDTYHHPRSRGY